jgi:hypothetical protein
MAAAANALAMHALDMHWGISVHEGCNLTLLVLGASSVGARLNVVRQSCIMHQDRPQTFSQMLTMQPSNATLLQKAPKNEYGAQQLAVVVEYAGSL